MANQTKCGCADPGCPAHKGHNACLNVSTTRLHRIDQPDATGTAMCEACGDDAFDSGVFDLLDTAELLERQKENNAYDAQNTASPERIDVIRANRKQGEAN